MNFEKIPCTSSKTRKHIERAYYQQQLWIQGPLKDASLEMNAESYGYTFVKKQFNSSWYCYPQPEDLPDPCTCDKCAHKNGLCRCRVAGIKCCKYCKYKGGESCKNPIINFFCEHHSCNTKYCLIKYCLFVGTTL